MVQGNYSVSYVSQFSGLINPWDDYIMFAVNNNDYYCIVGRYDRGKNTWSGTRYRVYRPYNGDYQFSSDEVSGETVTINYPLRAYSSVPSIAPSTELPRTEPFIALGVSFLCVFAVLSIVFRGVIKWRSKG